MRCGKEKNISDNINQFPPFPYHGVVQSIDDGFDVRHLLLVSSVELDLVSMGNCRALPPRAPPRVHVQHPRKPRVAMLISIKNRRTQ